MKKVTAIILCLLMCFSLCSCKKFKELKEKHAFFDEGGIVYKGVLYKPVEHSSEINYNYENQKFITVTEAGVPTLLSPFLQDSGLSMNEDETIIGDYSRCYVREDKYEEYLDSLENGINYTRLGFDYHSVELGENTDYILTDDEYNLFMSLIIAKPADTDVAKSIPFNDKFDIFMESDNELFRKNRYEVVLVDGDYYVGESIGGITTYYPSTPEADKMFNRFCEDYFIYSHDYGSN